MNVNDFIKQHEYKNYCEAIVYPNGDIEYAEQGHVNKLIEITGLPRCVINELMPNNASPLHWLTEYTKCIPLWEKFFIYSSITYEQYDTIQQLVNHNIICDNATGLFTDEYTRCNLLQKLYKGEITEADIPEKPNIKIQIRRN